MTAGTRILIADDHQIVRDGLRLILETEPEFTVVGEAEDGDAAVRLAKALVPDVILMDLRMPGIDGIQAISRIRQDVPQSEIVILTMYADDELMIEGFRLGARGYLLKDTDRARLFSAIRAASRGDTLLQSEVVERVLAQRGHAQKRRDPTVLTERERQILGAIIEGEQSKAIGTRFGITERTVKAHLARIYAKLGVTTRAGAVREALRRGLVTVP